jgi:hypothetical protein
MPLRRVLLQPFEIHLPQLVRRAAFKAPEGRPVRVLGPDRPMPRQHPVDGRHRDLAPLALQQHLQLQSAPAMLLPQFQNPLLQLLAALFRAVEWAPRMLP